MGNKTKRTYRYWRGTQEQWAQNALSSAVSCQELYNRVGANDPMYKSKISRGLNATNSLETTNQSVYYKPGKVRATWTSVQVNPERYGKVISASVLSGWSPTPHSSLPSSALRQRVSNAANIGIIKKIRKFETSDFSGPTFVGELRETLSMLRSPVKSLRLKTGLFTDLHMRILRDKQARGKRFKPDPWRKVVSDTYLEWTFGAAPLISDIGAIAQLAIDMKQAAFPNKGLKRLSYTFGDSESSMMDDVDMGWNNIGIAVKNQLVTHGRSSANYTVWIDQDLLYADSQLDWLANASKFRLDEIVPTLWELLPWSFLLDYWMNIGDLMGCTFNFNRNVKFGKVVTFDTVTKFHVNSRAVSIQPSTTAVVGFEPHSYTSQYTRVSRLPLSVVGFPNFEFQLPSLGQATNMLALITSLSKSNPFRGFTLK